MTAHLTPFLRVALVLAAALASMPLLRNAPASARRLVLSAAFALALVIPFAPSWHVDAPAVDALIGHVVAEPARIAGGATPTSIASTTPSPIGSATSWLAFAYAAGAMTAFVRVVVGAVRARRMVRRAAALVEGDGEGWLTVARVAASLGRRADVRVSEEVRAPGVTGVVAPVVLVPPSSKTWSEARWRSVLLHELAHVAALDLAVQALASIVCALHWFNPLAWAATRRLRLERELAADEAVLRAGTKASSYASDLLAIAGAAQRGMIAIAEPPLERRIRAIVAAKRPAALGVKGAVALIAAAAAVTFGAACSTSDASHAGPAAARAVDGEAMTTAAPELQATAERELDGAVKRWNATGGTILVLSTNGDVIADAGGRTDRAYVPGSTIKPIFLAAALDEGVVSEADVFDCSPRHGADAIADAEPHGSLDVAEMLAVSSNVGFAQLFDRLGGARAERALRRFGITPPDGLACRGAGDRDGALAAIGAAVTTTPRELASAYVAIAGEGGGVVSASTAARVRALLEVAVDSDKGTGNKARVEGVRVAGKTGSSSWTAKDGVETTYASFVGFVPADRPRYVIFVGVEGARQPTWGGEAAAPVFSRIARALALSSP